MGDKLDENKEEVLENKIEAVAEKIDETPANEKDEKWRAEVNSALMEIKAELAEIKKERGASAEMTLLLKQVEELAAEVKASRQSAAGAAPPSPATPPATSLEPEAKEPEVETSLPPARKNQRMWV